ncbi:uracil-DNA glycosylase family protein [Amorphus orientalis]|uniref:Uracil-DNA glycosylase n=1 Tax=Amorphus orientalis TaxID=649198 RepID=A0AAE3VRU4_9HYPH|nr:uracil-DNA glycosylase family protein [Amorphus orientalis]MDQ0316988.1 uracil-DNA glycosylase [Amorphus orientalis]
MSRSDWTGLTGPPDSALGGLTGKIRACRICVERPIGAPLPHEPRPVIRATESARIAVCGQAPGTRVHASGQPFTDPSGDRLRDWMGVDVDTFYDFERVAVVPMGFCFPGQDAKGGDLPPRRECARTWHDRVFASLPNLELILAVGLYAQAYHLPGLKKLSLTERVGRYREIIGQTAPVVVPLPHPSWRNNAWIRKNPWFETDLLPELRARVARALEA